MKRDAWIKYPARIILIAFVVLARVLSSPVSGQNSELTESVKAFNQGDYSRAALLAGNYLKTHPAQADARIVLARIQIAQGDFESAYRELRKVLLDDTANIDAHYYLGVVSGALSQIEYQKLYQLAPDSARVHQLMADSFAAQEKLSEAEAEYQAALKTNPQSTEVLIALGEILRTQSRFDEAISYYSRAMKAGPPNYDAAYGLGVCYAYRQEHARAIEYFRQALAIDPNSATGRFALGNSLWQAGQVAPAVKELQVAVALEPKMRQAFYLLGRAYRSLGQAQPAREAFRRADQLMKLEIETAQSALRPKDPIHVQPGPPQTEEQPRISTSGSRKKPTRKPVKVP